MSKLEPQNEWTDVRQLERTDFATPAVFNNQAQSLLNRIQFLFTNGIYAVDFVNDLNSLIKWNGRTVYVKSYSESVRGGGGIFQYDSSKKDINNFGTCINGWIRKEILTLQPAHFGINENIDDATESLRLLHAAANDLKLKVSYSGLKSFRVQADAKIVINTDVDFAHSMPKLLNSVKSTLSWNESFNEVFILYDEKFPIEDISLNSNNINEFYKGSKTFGRYTLSDGYLKITFNDVLFPNRADNGTRPLSLSYCLNHGIATKGLEFDARSLVANTSVKVRRSPPNRILIKNFMADMNEPNKQTLFRINRNRVDLDASWLKTTDQDCINTLIFVDDVADINILRAEGRGSENINNVGTYSVYLYGAAHIKIKNMHSHLGWGQLATHFSNDIDLEDSETRRIDAHEQVFNFTGRRCKLTNAIQYGNGGGNWIFEDMEFSLNPGATTLDIIAVRADYGKHFLGSITVNKSVLNVLDSTYCKFVNFDGMGSSVLQSELPDVDINNLTLNVTMTNSNADTYANRLSLLHLTTDTAKNAKIFKRMRITDLKINAFDGFKFYSLINFGMFSKNGDSPLEISKLQTINACVFQPNLINNRLSAGYSTAKFSLENISKSIKINFNSADSGISDYLFNNCYLTKCAAPQSFFPVTFTLKNVILDYVNTTDKLCGANNLPTVTRDYSLLDSIIIGDPDISRFSIFGNVAVRKYTLSGSAVSSTPTLPTGVTTTDLMLGWRDTNLYK